MAKPHRVDLVACRGVEALAWVSDAMGKAGDGFNIVVAT